MHSCVSSLLPCILAVWLAPLLLCIPPSNSSRTPPPFSYNAHRKETERGSFLPRKISAMRIGKSISFPFPTWYSGQRREKKLDFHFIPALEIPLYLAEKAVRWRWRLGGDPLTNWFRRRRGSSYGTRIARTPSPRVNNAIYRRCNSQKMASSWMKDEGDLHKFNLIARKIRCEALLGRMPCFTAIILGKEAAAVQRRGKRQTSSQRRPSK